MIPPVMKPYTMEWLLKSGFIASVMFKTLGNLFTAYCFITIFQHWYTMSTWITQSINFSKSNRDDNDDLVRYDIWSNKKKMRGHSHEMLAQ